LSRLDYDNAVLVGLPTLRVQLSAVSAHCSTLPRDPSPAYDAPTTSPTLASSPEHVHYKLATIVSRSLKGKAADLRRLSDMPSRRRLRSSLTDQPDRLFAVAGA